MPQLGVRDKGEGPARPDILAHDAVISKPAAFVEEGEYSCCAIEFSIDQFVIGLLRARLFERRWNGRRNVSRGDNPEAGREIIGATPVPTT